MSSHLRARDEVSRKAAPVNWTLTMYNRQQKREEVTLVEAANLGEIWERSVRHKVMTHYDFVSCHRVNWHE